MGLGVIVLGLLGIMIGPPVILVIIGLRKRSTNKDTARIFYILGVAWLVIGGGICATLIMG